MHVRNAKLFGEFDGSLRADVGIGPYIFPESWFSQTKTPPLNRGEVSRGTTLIVLAHISALLYREAPAALVARPLGTGCTRSQRKGSHRFPSLLARLLRMLGLSSR